MRLNLGIYSLFHEFQAKYNKNEALIFTTIQSYLKESRQLLQDEITRKQRRGLKTALKVVRGAYMLEERALA